MTLSKLLITGPLWCGKSEFIQSASEISLLTTASDLATEGAQSHLAADFGHITLNGHLLYLFGTSYAQNWLRDCRFEMDAVILLVNSSSEFAHEARSFLPQISHYPYIIVANKQDCYDALSLTTLRDQLGLGVETFLHPCDARNRGNVLGILHEALKLIRPSVE